MGVPGPSYRGWLSGRANRKEYWLFIAAVFGVGLVLSSLPPAGQSVGVGVVTMVQIRRLHDIGRTGWWVVANLGLQVVTAVGLIAANPPASVFSAVVAVVTLIPIAWLGALPGEPFENRFGPPPGKRSLKDVFS